MRMLQEAVTVTEASGDLYWGSWAELMLGESYFFIGDLTQALPHCERAARLAERIDNPGHMAYGWSLAADSLFRQGAWDQARREYERALGLVPRAGDSWGTWVTLTHFGRFCVAQGRWDEAEYHLAEALALTERTDDVQWRFNVLDALAELDLLRGQPARALERLDPVRQPQANHPATDIVSMMSESHSFALGWVLLEAGETAEAAALAVQGLEHATAILDRFFLPAWLELSGAAAARLEHWEEAERYFEEGLSQARAMGMPYWEGRILYRAGVMSAERAEPEQAREQLVKALVIFQRLGALPYLERTEQALAELDRR
jgi:tetratricopeptide (TPR) repeat protein